MISAQDLVKSVELDGISYTIAMAPADKQRAVMFRLGKYGLEPAIRQMALAQVGAQSVEAIMLGIMGTMMYRIPEEDFNFILDTILYKVRRAGDQNPVTINDFTGRMQDYTRLAILALGVNFADFSNFLTLFQKSIVEEPAGEKEAQQQPETSTQPSTGFSGDPA